ncbi:MAG TPA: alpha/beta hydrolase-fold protein [Lachnospiraceae bacterium]|nr:alpha/beta hydrolase-fold protein [Lachnospiraceae bacterium]
MHKKSFILISILLVINLIAVSCSSKKTSMESGEVLSPSAKNESASNATENSDETDKTDKPVESDKPVEIDNWDETDKTNETNKSDIPTQTDTSSSSDSSSLNEKLSDRIPNEYTLILKEHRGTIEQISYQTHDYFGDNSEITKPAYVYLPYGYDEEEQYNVLYLMHGIGGNEKEWGMYNDVSKVKIMLDNLIENGDIEPFIVVAPNGRSSADYADTSSDYSSFYQFGKELRNDLIPYIEANFATYADYKEDGYDMTAARDHRAMGGLSMGGMQTINIGMCECLDIISNFGAFSAAPTTNTSVKIVDCLKSFEEYDINCFYNICGSADNIAWPSATAAVTRITSLTDRLKEGDNYFWQEVEGGVHDFNVWYLGFYNYARIIFKK